MLLLLSDSGGSSCSRGTAAAGPVITRATAAVLMLVLVLVLVLALLGQLRFGAASFVSLHRLLRL
jgi:hypothetical protein